MVSFTRSHSVGGGGVVAFLGSGTFSGHRQVTRRSLTLTQIQAHLPGLITHSNHVTKSIHSRKIICQKFGGGMAPLATPLVATQLANRSNFKFNGFCKTFCNVLTGQFTRMHNSCTQIANLASMNTRIM